MGERVPKFNPHELPETEGLDTIRLPGRARVVAIRVFRGRMFVFSKSRVYELVPRPAPARKRIKNRRKP